jgi:hypothetical protein
MPEMKNVAGGGYRVTHVGDPAVAVGNDLRVLPGQVFLAGEQAVVVVAFADRGDEPVDQHSRTLGPVVPLVDLGSGHPSAGSAARSGGSG